MQDFIAFLLKYIVTDIDAVQFESAQNADNNEELIVKVPSEQMGLVIGKQGKTISTIRQLAKLHGNIHNHHTMLRLEEPTA